METQAQKVAASILELAGFTPEMIEMAIWGDSRSPDNQLHGYGRFNGFSDLYEGAMITYCVRLAEPVLYQHSGEKNRGEVGFKYLHGDFKQMTGELNLQKIGNFTGKYNTRTLYAGTFNKLPIFLSFIQGRECQGDYSGACLTSHKQAYEFARYILDTPGYDFKDMDVFHNGLGGFGWNDLQDKTIKPHIDKLLEAMPKSKPLAEAC